MRTKYLFAFLTMIVLAVSIMSTSTAMAAGYDIKEMTPEVKAALDARRSRFEQLRQFKEKGVIGENNRGYVQALGSDPVAESLVVAENKDRKFIYQTIVTQNDLPSDALATVEQVFAQVQRDKAASGEKVQTPGGEWVTK